MRERPRGAEEGRGAHEASRDVPGPRTKPFCKVVFASPPRGGEHSEHDRWAAGQNPEEARARSLRQKCEGGGGRADPHHECNECEGGRAHPVPPTPTLKGIPGASAARRWP